MKMLTQSLLAVSALAASVLAAPQPAEACRPATMHHRPAPMRQDVSLTVVDAMGRSLPTVMHQGTVFVAGSQGQRYALEARNNTAQRVELVVSVDGRDAVSGQMADFRTNRGYVLDAFGSVEIEGFRTSMHDVAAFRFSNVSDSFSARMGTPQNAGVIGVAVFHERRQAIAQRPMNRPMTKDRKRTRAPAADASATPESPAPTKSRRAKSVEAERRSRPGSAMQGFTPSPHHELGTEFGERMGSEVVEVSFVRQNPRRPDFMTTVMYDTPRGLAARGVPIDPMMARDDRFTDQPFPVAVGDGRFASPPPGRRR
jgi:hypothetical protein